MKTNAQNGIDGIVIAYIGGGSRAWALQLMTDLATETRISGTVRLFDIDAEAARENRLLGNRISEEAGGKWRYETSDTIGEALTGADFAIISILPGTFAEMGTDVHLPERYGIWQSVGDTTGPGGLVRALRTIPMYVDIASAIKKHAPTAWVINYTNPMALCVRTLYEVFPEIKAFGCCHEVFGVQALLAELVKERAGSSAPSREDIKVNVLGVNHFTWIDSASYLDIDLFPLYERLANEHYETGYANPDRAGLEYVFTSMNRVKFDLFRRYGLVAAAGDRHLAEFCPREWYLKDPETVAKWKFHLTSIDFRIDQRKEIEARRKRLVAGTEKIEIKPTGEEGVRQMKALLGLGDFVTNVNLPNRGQVTGLPAGVTVETNALVSRNSMKPVMAGSFPSDLGNIVARHSANQDAILEAGMKRDRRLALNALLNDPLVNLDPKDAGRMLDEMIEATKKYLPGW